MERGDGLAVTFLTGQFARFLVLDCNDSARAHEVFSQACSSDKCATRQLFQAWVTLAKARPAEGEDAMDIDKIYEKALSLLDKEVESPHLEDLKGICQDYLQHLEDKAREDDQAKKAYREARDKMEQKGWLKDAADDKTTAAQLGHKRAAPADAGDEDAEQDSEQVKRQKV